jgi:hypothetical protein
MFKKILEKFTKVNNPFHGYLGDLWTVWCKDAGCAILMARWSWQNIPEELIHQSAAVQQQAQSAQMSSQINRQVNAQLGSMGIFPCGGGGGSFGFGMDPDQTMFIMIMGAVRAHRGNPPTSHGLEQLAESVLRGQMDPVDALVETAPAFTQEELISSIEMLKMVNMDKLLRLQAIIQVASALPRDRIPAFVPEVENL